LRSAARACNPAAYTAIVTTLLFALLLAAPTALPASPTAPAPPAASPTAAAPPAVVAPPVAAATAAGAVPAPECGLVPGWSQRDGARRYDAETLFEYKNGASEAYFAYGFTRMQGVTCVDATGAELVIDVSELGDPDRAWGFFVANQDVQSPVEPIGSGRQLLPGSAALAKGRYYVEITALPDGDRRTALGAFLDALLPRIPGEAHLPEAVSYFPPEGLEPGSLRLVPESVLGLRVLKTGFLAQYAVGRAFVVAEASLRAASDTLAQLRAPFTDARPAGGLGEEGFTAQDPYLDGLVVFRKGRHVAGVANVAAGQDALPLAKALAARLPE
jgi:hypothetical protein